MSWFWDCSGLGRGIFVGVLVVICCFLWLGYCFVLCSVLRCYRFGCLPIWCFGVLYLRLMFVSVGFLYASKLVWE